MRNADTVPHANTVKQPFRMAIAYDFDGTLMPGCMQDCAFFPELGIKDPEKDFWEEVRTIARKNNMDEILSYMHLMLHKAQCKVSLKRESFHKQGKDIPYFPGVDTWFPRINAFAERYGVELKHYIISSGLREIIEGTTIAGYFSAIFASGFMYDKDDVAFWPALAVNYTNKTQYLFRINKGIENCWDNRSLNTYTPQEQRPIPQQNIIYIGDGDTDIPAMKMTRYLGGYAIAVYNPEKEEKKEAAETLLQQGRANCARPADYRENSVLEKTVKRIIALRADISA